MLQHIAHPTSDMLLHLQSWTNKSRSGRAGLRVNLMIIGYGSDAVTDAARSSHPGLGGLVGLPFLREFRYGGDAHKFWIA